VLPLVIGFLGVAVLFATNIWFIGQQRQAIASTRHALDTVILAKNLMAKVEEAETGQRGYLLAHDDAYLTPYREARETVSAELNALQAALKDKAEQADAGTSLRRLIDQKFEELEHTVSLAQNNQQSEAVAIVKSDVGLKLTGEIRTAIDKIIAFDQVESSAARARIDWTGTWIERSGISGILLLGAVISYALWRSYAHLASLVAARDSLAAANERIIEEAAHRGKLEEQLRQSQKMEAIGQLTGGIAHDFNNMLAVIMGSLNLLKRRMARGEGNLDQFIEAAVDGVERAAALTQRLLAFSRQQPLAPQPTDINKFVAGISDLLRRTLGESVQLETVLAGGLWRTRVDPSQLENAILNLAVNSRDAMPEGGRLTIETGNYYLDEQYASQHVEVPEGQYVLVSITDTGIGMSADTIARAFDPFFSTKGPGKGTGLGLSQVHGFVKQSGGHIKIYSEIGRGTTVKIYLPRFYGAAAEAEVERSEPIKYGNPNEVVLVVEDEERARQVSCQILEELGYTVLEAADAERALQIITARDDISLLFTDIVMPNMNGRELAVEAQRLRPSMTVLYTTGYTKNAIVHNGTVDPGVLLISKPFSLDRLAAMVRRAIDATS
jgi:signal transduction histidine kinase/ActR/RegA family two-component response regulator